MTLLKYTITHNGNNWQNYVIDLPTGLTIQERKLHRSCLNYRINGGYLFDSNQDVKVKLATIPDNWAVRASIRRGRNAWLKMHRELLKENPSLKPKWHDYKIRMLTSQQSYWSEKDGGAPTYYRVPEDVFDDNLPHEDNGLNWSLYIGSNTADENSDEFNAHVLGPTTVNGGPGNITSVGLLQSWIDSRPDLDPPTTISGSESDTMTSDPIMMLENDGDDFDEIVDNFDNAIFNNGQQEGDIFPPYHLQNPPNEPQEKAAAFTTISSPISYFTGFNAMLGQVFLRINSSKSGSIDLIFDVDPRGETI